MIKKFEMIKVSNPNMNDSEIKKQLKMLKKMLTPNGLLLQKFDWLYFFSFFLFVNHFIFYKKN